MWTAIILAGERPGGDPFAASLGVAAKALIPVGGVPMLARVASTLLDCPDISRILVLAQDIDRLRAHPGTAWLADEARVEFGVSAAGIAGSVRAVAGVAAPWPVLVTTADHALLTPPMVAAFLGSAGSADVAFAVVERRVLLAAYPNNVRTWLRFRGGAWSGANLFALSGPRAFAALDLWAGVERERKSGWRLILKLGPGLLLGAVLRVLTIEAAAAQLGRRLGLTAKAVALPFAEAAIDVDKASDLALAEAIVAAR
ncbi:NTP transferase domain-containing protein [Glacieibacterium frigidum]|uniref:4-diphosphocytidyl-2C-methyl-D-erythritol synthase n=1 Tax=Glacieibacterium frigidum TaxID=2593303 RepID=A0A552UGF4_9SPHN|nr:NTP transferase domain-containing protein [Glacieibacterium frigidum]TRW17267.1 4-diphosphocytidyl-2C-methyl-D-erythritol synthase [Glacieibacterium frigidum]